MFKYIPDEAAPSMPPHGRSEGSRRGVVAATARRAPYQHPFEAVPLRSLSDGSTLVERSMVDGVATWWFVDFRLRRLIRQQTAVPDRFPTGIKMRSRVADRLARSPAMVAVDAFSQWRTRRWADGLEANPGAVGSRLHDDPSPTAYDPRGPVLVLAQHRNWRAVTDPKSGKETMQGSFWGPVLNELRQRLDNPVLTLYPAGGYRWPWRPSMDDRRTIEERRLADDAPDHIVADSFWSPAVSRTQAHARRILTRAWDEASEDPVLAGLLPKGDRVGSMVRPWYDQAFATTMPRGRALVHLFERLLSAHRPSRLLVLNEYGRVERPLVVAAARVGVPTLAMQHGIIYPDHPGYGYEKGAIATGTMRCRGPHVPVPDLTATYGPKARAVLLDSGYGDDMVVVTGHPRNDLLHTIGTLDDRGPVRRRLGLDGSSWVLLWSAQAPILPAAEQARYVRALRDWTDATRDAVLLVKPHPMETGSLDSYLAGFGLSGGANLALNGTSDAVVARRDDGKVVLCSPGSDIYGLLAACDALVTKNSTTAIEAAAIGRPVVVLNLDGQADVMDYVEGGLAQGVYDEVELLAALDQVRRDPDAGRRERDAYVAEQLHLIDGRTAERIVDAMASMRDDRMLRHT